MGGYTCRCVDGYQGDGYFCADENECESNSTECHDNATCTNTPGSYTCKCANGFWGNGYYCEDKDECQLGTECPQNEECFNTLGSYQCQCKPGFTVVGIAYVNECKLGIANCDINSLCRNTNGSFTCECLRGYIGDGVTCHHIPNPCGPRGQNTCHKHADCFPTLTAYKCICQAGYDGDGFECIFTKPCDIPGTCHQDATCVSVGRRAVCSCISPLRGDGHSCEPVDECAEGTAVCDVNSICVDIDNGYKCLCKYGYYGNGKKQCKDVNECDAATPHGGRHLCDIAGGAVCENTNGSYVCACASGMGSPNGLHGCETVNECKSRRTNKCGKNTYCHNTRRGYYCACRIGFHKVGDMYSCEDIDECREVPGACNVSHAVCVNEKGGYKCLCEPGYDGDGLNCTDIDECSLQKAVCHQYASCRNTDGTFNCTCDAGYEGNGLSRCDDVNECDSMNGGCPENADCINEPGSRLCRYIDECVTDTTCVASGSVCINSPGSYQCGCDAGYRLNAAVDCIDINECLLVDTDGVGLCGNGSSCHNLPGSCRCICAAGFTTPEAETCAPCTEIDECVESVGLCGLGSCENTKGSYQCVCPDGYLATDGTCSNINECNQPLNSEYAHDCENSTCVDDEPGYKCSCWPGYTQDSPTRCVDIDECLTHEVCGDHSDCLNIVSSYKCLCHDGYVWDDNVCADRNECEWIPEIFVAAANQQPAKTRLGHTSAAVTKVTDSPLMESVQEAALCGAGDLMCVNLEGSYKCSCPPGYTAQGGACVSEYMCPLPLVTPATRRRGAPVLGGACVSEYMCPLPLVTPATRRRGAPVLVSTCVPYPLSPRLHGAGGACVVSTCVFLVTGRGACVSEYMCTLPLVTPATRRRGAPVLVSTCVPYPLSPGYTAQGLLVSTVLTLSPVHGAGGACVSEYMCTLPLVTPATRRRGAPVLGGACVSEYMCTFLHSTPCQTSRDCTRRRGGACVNVDECATGAHYCDVDTADCVDTVGSYKCYCRTGFVGNGRHCSPICQPGVCPGRQLCMVTEGEAECSCKCSGDVCSNTGSVCGSNGQTYDSQTDLILVACRSGKDISLDYHGACKVSCDEVSCSKWAQCHMVNGRPTCQCPEHCPVNAAGGLVATVGGNSKGAVCVFPFVYQGVSHTDCVRGATGRAWCSTTADYDKDGKSGDCVYEVCSASGETFATYCKFQQRMCALNSDEDIIQFGKCVNSKECIYGEYGRWSGCSVSCGQGFQSRWRPVLVKPDWPPRACRDREQRKKCYEAPCKGDNCETFPCNGPAEFCVLHHGHPVCECPHCAFVPRLPRVFSCEGGCGKVTGYCCDPTELSYKHVQFVCPGGATKVAKLLQIEQCGCVRGRMSRQLSLIVAP
ncbi:hypothetical protein NP493_455g01025 [Ridgeia piscesae]|uniref:Uncharacterized protein n=1 Tax=Ridgeia piscesae TaxID=27915 RepID=A0AAD9KZG0_RIDPI|nr:hypothetical protein NP493_455g01025 [Ridgeia piscesae]